MVLEVAVSGDSILNRRVSVVDDARFLDLIEPFREADAAFTHLETNVLEYDDPDAYPAAEAGGTWMRSPPYTADELDWMGIDLVSHASNHSLDYSYGGLRSTWRALDRAGIAHAGTGEDLGDARSPTYLETPGGRVALVSMASSITPWSRAGASRADMRGRPGINPMRFHHAVDDETLADLKDLAERMGYWITDAGGGRWIFNPSGLHNTLFAVREADEVRTVPDERDLEGNLRAIADAAARADVTVAHLHTHEFDPEGGIGVPADFVETVAREAVEAGADVFVAQGSHSPLRGIEVHEGAPIFYDPGDLFRMSDTVERLPAEFYRRFEDDLDVHPADATPSEGLRARKGGGDPGTASGYSDTLNPPGGYHAGSVMGNVIPVCSFEGDEVAGIELHPGTFVDDPSPGEIGLPVRAEGDTAEEIVADVAAKSEAYGTAIRFEDGIGVVEV